MNLTVTLEIEWLEMIKNRNLINLLRVSSELHSNLHLELTYFSVLFQES